MKLVNMNDMLQKAYKGKYAVPHINTNNLESTKAILEIAQEENSPIIIGASMGAIKYMGGVNTVLSMVKGLMEDLKTSVPVALHLDHGSFQYAVDCIKVGFSSVMYDGSHEKFDVNLENIKKVLELAKPKNISVEAEVGTIGGEEDGIIGSGEVADPKEFKQVAELGVTVLAAGINNVHGKYPDDWSGLRFDILKDLQNVYKIPMVLHGGSGIPRDQVQKAISLGISKINVNTELQLSFCDATRKYFDAGSDKIGKGYDPRKIMAGGVIAMKDTIREKIREFGSNNKA